jgi:cytoskeletal protein CcmA (bactofilin family)
MIAPRVRYLLVVVLIVSLLAAAPAAAQETRSGGTVVVAEGEVHEGDLSVLGGTVVVDGTVDGSLEGLAGSVLVTGTVTGDVEVSAGAVTVRGVVEGNVESASGSVTIGEDARIGGNLEVGAGSLALDGRVDGDVTAGVETLTVGETARIAGDLTYAAESVTIADGAQIGGATERRDSLDLDVGAGFPVIGGAGTLFASGVFTVFGFLVNLLLGVVVLLAAPRFAERVTETGVGTPAKAGAAGLATLLGVPVVLVAVAITIVGIPLTIAGFLTFLVVLWVAFVYGALVAGTWLLSLGDYESRWGALALGLAVPAVASLIPFGGLVSLVYLLLGLGAFALAALARRRGGATGAGKEEGEDRPPEDVQAA